MAQLGGQSTTSSMFKMLETSPSKRNKRKSAEPMKRLSSNSEQDIIDNQKSEHRLPLATQFKNYSNSLQTSTGQNEKCYYKRPKLEQTSDGEDHHTSPSPRLSSSLSPGSSTECRSPSPFSLAPPKKRFKIDTLKDETRNQDRSEIIKAEPFLGPRDNDDAARGQKSPFRPWISEENNSKQEEIIKTEPQPIIPAGIYHPYLLLLQHPKALELAGSLQQPTLSSFGRNLTHQQTTGPIENSLRIPSGFPPNSLENSLRIPSGFPQNSLENPCFEPEQKEPLALVIKKEPTEPVQKINKSKSDNNKKRETNTDQDMGENDKQINNENNVNKKGNNGKQRNYKNMTRERRVEANARERQRVQTITEQFEYLRSAIPTEDKCAKMSKLSIIKIATSYIMYLSRQCGYDYTTDKSEPTIEECYGNLMNLINYESKLNGGGSNPASTENSTSPPKKTD